MRHLHPKTQRIKANVAHFVEIGLFTAQRDPSLASAAASTALHDNIFQVNYSLFALRSGPAERWPARHAESGA